MIRESVFCDICENELRGERDGVALFFNKFSLAFTDRVFVRNFGSTEHSDLHLCNSCIGSLVKIFAGGCTESNCQRCRADPWEKHKYVHAGISR